MNYLHKWHLVEAEWARVSGAELAAMKHYDQAISLARKNGFPQEEALANADSATNLLWLLNNGPDSKIAQSNESQTKVNDDGASFTEFTLNS